MKLLIDSSKRFLKKISLTDSNQQAVASVGGGEDILTLIDKVLKKGKAGLPNLTSVEAVMIGESRVGINIGVSAANALNYALGLKKIGELEFPEDPQDKFRE